MSRTAVVLYNLGGPITWQDTEHFLYNLFTDPYIIRLPSPLRQTIAWLISRLRSKKAQGIYKAIGGGSPLYANSLAQAEALQHALDQKDGIPSFRVFLAMRYWHPRTRSVLPAIQEYKPERILLVPLYPQFSTTTTESFQAEWRHEARNLDIPVQALCCYPTLDGWVKTMAEAIDDALTKAPQNVPQRIIFSAHGLPQKIVDQGDPYPSHVAQSVAAIVAALHHHEVDWRISYQSRVGPMKWLAPSTEDEIERAGRDGVGVIIVPVAFVSEHSETLYELDQEYRSLAEEYGVPSWGRVPTAGTQHAFIASLADRIQDVLEGTSQRCGDVGGCAPRCYRGGEAWPRG